MMGKGAKKKAWKHLICGMLCVIFVMSVCSCKIAENKGAEGETEEQILWVLTEISNSDGMNNQAKQVAEAFEKVHENITVKLEILPTDTEEREIYLQKLRTQIMAGKGPDVYLLPTASVLKTDTEGRGSQQRISIEYEVEPLFPDVVQAMYNGVFADISTYYDADTELKTEQLNGDIMAAGKIDDCRYVLPIRYDVPTLFADVNSTNQPEFVQLLLSGGMSELTQEIIEKNANQLAMGLEIPTDTLLLPGLFDYEKGELKVTEDEIATYMRLYQAWYAKAASMTPEFLEYATETHYQELDALQIPDVTREILPEMFPITLTRESFLSHLDCIITAMHWSNMGFYVYSGGLQNALEQSVIAWVLDSEFGSYPFRNLEGNVVAEVTYYGAVGAGSAKVELAYEFLRAFLTEEHQWELSRPQTDRSKDDIWLGWARELQNDGLVEESWPVRSSGAAGPLWKNWSYQLYYDYNNFFPKSTRLYRLFGRGEIVTYLEDMNVLNHAVDEVRFPIFQSYEESLSYALTLLNTEDGTPTDVDIEALAEEVYWNLWWHLAEG